MNMCKCGKWISHSIYGSYCEDCRAKYLEGHGKNTDYHTKHGETNYDSTKSRVIRKVIDE